MSTHVIGVVAPTQAGVDLARRNIDRLTRAVKQSTQPVSITVPSVGTFDVPPAVVGALMTILHQIAEGHVVTLHAMTDDEELSTTEAARLLGMSRPTFIDLVESGAVPYRWVGSHRRLGRSAVLAAELRMADGAATADSRRAERLEGLREMSETTHGLGLGY